MDSDAREGVHALTCGHVAHAACHDRYFRSVAGVGSEHAADDRAAAETAEARARAGLAANDFTCPTCRRLCNALAPVMPPTLAQAAFFEAGGREGASARRRFFEAGNGAGGGGEEGFSFEEEEGGANEPERVFARGPGRARAFCFGPTRAALAEGFKRVVAEVRASVTLEASDRARVDFAGAEPATAAGGTRPGFEGAGEGSSSDADALDRALDRVELEPAVEEVRPSANLVRPRLFSDGQYVERLRGTARPEGEFSVERAAESFEEPPARARRHADAYWARHADTRVWAAAFERATRVAARAGAGDGHAPREPPRRRRRRRRPGAGEAFGRRRRRRRRRASRRRRERFENAVPRRRRVATRRARRPPRRGHREARVLRGRGWCPRGCGRPRPNA
jgi:hypothetical protein